MAGLHYVAIKINKQASLYPKIIHARPYGVGLNFIKRETKTRLWVFALHDLVENSNKMYKKCFYPFSLFVLLFKSWFTHRVWPVSPQITST